MIFAEVSNQFTPPGGIAGWLACLAFVLWIIHLVQKIHAYSKSKPQPGDVQRESAEKFVTKPEFQSHVAKNDKDHDNIFSKIGGVERGTNTATENRVEGVRKDLVVVSNQVASLQTETKIQNQQLSRIERTISEMPGKIVADLVNAKKL